MPRGTLNLRRPTPLDLRSIADNLSDTDGTITVESGLLFLRAGYRQENENPFILVSPFSPVAVFDLARALC